MYSVLSIPLSMYFGNALKEPMNSDVLPSFFEGKKDIRKMERSVVDILRKNRVRRLPL